MKSNNLTPEQSRIVKLIFEHTDLPLKTEIKFAVSFNPVITALEDILINGTKKDRIRLQACYVALNLLGYEVPLPITLLGGLRTGYFPWIDRRNTDIRLADRRKSLDCGRCQVCGSQEQLEVHHKTPLYLGGQDNLDNLITLCRQCHVEEHRKIRCLN